MEKRFLQPNTKKKTLGDLVNDATPKRKSKGPKS
jgi:hypothetical protein